MSENKAISRFRSGSHLVRLQQKHCCVYGHSITCFAWGYLRPGRTGGLSFFSSGRETGVFASSVFAGSSLASDEIQRRVLEPDETFQIRGRQ